MASPFADIDAFLDFQQPSHHKSPPDFHQCLDGIKLREYVSYNNDMVILSTIESANLVTEDSLEFAKQR